MKAESKKMVLSYSSVVCQDFTEWLHHNRGQGQISVFYVTSGICQLPVINVNVLFKLLHISDSVGIYYMNEKFNKELMWKRKICTLSTLKSLREIFYMVLIVSLLFPSYLLPFCTNSPLTQFLNLIILYTSH